jgi:alkaline phosphatase
MTRCVSFFAMMAAVCSAAASNVIFIHPDGAGISHWQAARFHLVGPDGMLNWDRLPQVALYRGHMADSLTATSNGGATTHAYGVKVPSAAFGTDGVVEGPAMAASGERKSLTAEAAERGWRTGLVNSGSIIEPGTACFAASVPSRQESASIARQVVESGADIILSGGEEWLLPVGKKGRHVAEGRREDGVDLIEQAREAGYVVVYDRAQLKALSADTPKVLGVFASGHTFNDMAEGEMMAAGLEPYSAGAPTVAEMTRAALRFLGAGPFFLVVEEEGTDNFGNYNNGRGMLEALRRADEALGAGLEFLEGRDDTLLITTADSAAGAMEAIGFSPSVEKIAMARFGRDVNGAPFGLDGRQPYLSQPDKNGVRHPFVLSWGTVHDSSGGILVRAAGRGAERVAGDMDNTEVYRVMRAAMFGD